MVDSVDIMSTNPPKALWPVHPALRSNPSGTSMVRYLMNANTPILLRQLRCHNSCCIYNGSNDIEIDSPCNSLQRLAPSLPCYRSIVDEVYRHIVTILKHNTALTPAVSGKCPLENHGSADGTAAPMIHR